MSFFNPFRNTPGKTGGPSAAAEKPGTRKADAGTPLELINYDTTTGKFHLGQDALRVLRSVTGPVGVVAISGRARQGKSFILNQLLGQTRCITGTGFVVAPTHRPCTKGLWMWSSPIERKNADGSKYHLVLLDTEGIDAYDQTGQYSTQIFSLAVLLSSLFVYNQMGGIDEAALDRLSLVTEMTKHVRVRAGSAAGEGEQELREFNPAFLWLLRDFYLDLEEDGRKLTPREYLEVVLRPLKGQGPSVDAKNKIRDSIKTLFPNRDCFSLIRPMNDENQLTKLDSIPPSQLRPQFVEDIKRLTRLIFMRAQPKRLGTQIISGAMLAALAEAYVDAINHGAVPTIATAWQGVAEAECRRAADAAEAAYNGAFDADSVTDESSLDAENRRCLSIAAATYADGAIGDESIKRANEKRYLERLESQYRQFRQQRLISSEAECRRMISDFTTKITQLANRDATGLADLQAELSQFDRAYREAPGTDGPSKWQLHADFMQGTFAGIARGIVQRQERAATALRTQTEQKLQEAQGKAVSLQKRIEELQSSLAGEQTGRNQAASKISALEQQLQAMSLSKEKQQKEINELKQQLDSALANSSHAETSAKQELSQAKRQLSQTQAELSKLREKASSQTSTAAELQTKAAELSTIRTDLETMKGRLNLANKEIAEATAARKSAESQLADLQRKLTAAQQATGPTDMEEDGYDTPDEDRTAHLTPDKMKINDIKDWLTENGHENVVWDLTTSRAKKPRYVEEMNKVLGRT